MKISPETADRVLRENPHMKVSQDFFEAIRDGKLPEYYLQRFALYRLYSDELPWHRLVGLWHAHYPMMKCRLNCLLGITTTLRSSMSQEVIQDEELKEDITVFVGRRWNAGIPGAAKGEYWTTSEEIERINDMLDSVMTYIEKTHGIHTDWLKAYDEFRSAYQSRRRDWGH